MSRSTECFLLNASYVVREEYHYKKIHAFRGCNTAAMRILLILVPLSGLAAAQSFLCCWSKYQNIQHLTWNSLIRLFGNGFKENLEVPSFGLSHLATINKNTRGNKMVLLLMKGQEGMKAFLTFSFWSNWNFLWYSSNFLRDGSFSPTAMA